MDPTIKQYIEAYIKRQIQNEQPIAFHKFVADNHPFILEKTQVSDCNNLQATWATRFGLVLRELNVAAIDSRRKPDWNTLALDILQRIAADSNASALILSSTRNSKSPISTSCSSSAASKVDSFPLTADAKAEFLQRFLQLDDAKKWKLKTGRHVEDVMHEYGTTLPNEHPVHSFILCIDDPVWKSVFQPKEYEEIVAYGNLGLPSLDNEVNEYFSALRKRVPNGVKDLEEEALLDVLADAVMKLGPYDFRTQFDLYWLRSALEQILSYYKYNVINKLMPNISEIDLVARSWSILDRCFDNNGVITGRDRTCLAASLRMNKDRGISGMKKIDEKKSTIRPDLILLKNDFEYGCSEVGKSTDVVPTKKEIVETCLHNPKTMKDMFDRIANEVDNDEVTVRKLQTVCFHHTSRRMKVALMDCPGGYVCRVQETKEYEIPLTISSLLSQIVPMLILTLQVKTIVKNTSTLLEAYKSKLEVIPELKAMNTYQHAQGERDAKTIILPPVLTIFAPATAGRKRTIAEVA